MHHLDDVHMQTFRVTSNGTSTLSRTDSALPFEAYVCYTNYRLRKSFRLEANLRSDRFGNIHESQTPETFRFCHHCRLPAICVLTNTCMQRDVSQEIDPMCTACPSNSFGSEDVCAMVALWAGENRHILNHAENLGRVLEND